MIHFDPTLSNEAELGHEVGQFLIKNLKYIAYCNFAMIVDCEM